MRDMSYWVRVFLVVALVQRSSCGGHLPLYDGEDMEGHEGHPESNPENADEYMEDYPHPVPIMAEPEEEMQSGMSQETPEQEKGNREPAGNMDDVIGRNRVATRHLPGICPMVREMLRPWNMKPEDIILPDILPDLLPALCQYMANRNQNAYADGSDDIRVRNTFHIFDNTYLSDMLDRQDQWWPEGRNIMESDYKTGELSSEHLLHDRTPPAMMRIPPHTLPGICPVVNAMTKPLEMTSFEMLPDSIPTLFLPQMCVFMHDSISQYKDHVHEDMTEPLKYIVDKRAMWWPQIMDIYSARGRADKMPVVQDQEESSNFRENADQNADLGELINDLVDALQVEDTPVDIEGTIEDTNTKTETRGRVIQFSRSPVRSTGNLPESKPALENGAMGRPTGDDNDDTEDSLREGDDDGGKRIDMQ